MLLKYFLNDFETDGGLLWDAKTDLSTKKV